MVFENPLTCNEIAKIIGGTLIGDSSFKIHSINRIEDAKPNEMTFLYNSKYEKYLATTQASLILISKDIPLIDIPNRAYLVVNNPYKELLKILQYIESLLPKLEAYIHPTAIIGNNCKISKSAYIGPYCVIGDNCIIEDKVCLRSHITLYDNVQIGDKTLIHSNVTCYSDTKIGKECIIHSGAVIGSDGFGNFENQDGTYQKIPQLGNVIVGDNVEIGANTTIDRALIGSTVIENGVKLDNLVHIAHNVRVGEHTAMAAQVGISGSVKIGKRNRLGGQVGLSGHIETADDVLIYAQAGVPKSILEPGTYSGTPARNKMLHFKIEAVLNNLPEIYKDIKKIKEKLEHLEKNYVKD